MNNIFLILAAILGKVRGKAAAGAERIALAASQAAQVVRGVLLGEALHIRGHYTFECIAPDGTVRWRDEARNLVVTVGKNDLLDKYFAGSAYTAAFYLGLVDNAGFSAYAAGDTMSSHAGWTEATPYSNSTRPAVSWNAASAGSKASTTTAFTINATATLNGGFLSTNSTKGGTTGTLFSGSAFTGGNRTVANGDTLNVTYTASA